METFATPIRKREVYDYMSETTNEIHLLLKDILQHDKAITYEDGEKVYALISQALTKEKKVILDFQGITIVIPAFLHAYSNHPLQGKHQACSDADSLFSSGRGWRGKYACCPL